ncbi:MAG: hypothetical protein KBA95_02335 [Acidobacteria bacterium]|nr:hypothetical protein [Acidobacteriota bacterium]
MRERVQLFGARRSLVGVVSVPDSVSGERPAAVLLNAGLIHRIGPNRLHVQIARALAEHGFVSARFDMSGRGDSDARADTVPWWEGSLAEIDQVLTALSATYGVTRFVLIGVCSGAALSLGRAMEDERVVGLGLIEAWAYPTRRWRIRHLLAGARQPASWRRALRRLAGRVRLAGRDGPNSTGSTAEAAMDGEGGEEGRVPPREQMAAALQALVTRGVNLLFIYSGGGEGGRNRFNYEGQLADAFPEVDFGSRAQVRIFPDADHTFTLLSNQDALVAAFSDWMTSTFPGGRRKNAER